MSDSVLEFVDVTVGVQPPYDVGLTHVSFSLRAGELLLVNIHSGHNRIPLADAAEGLIDPEEGDVAFLGESWRSIRHERAPSLRGRIGRVFESHGWVSNLDVDENVTLAQRYHTRRREKEIYDEAEQLAHAFGLPELPRVRPAMLAWGELRRAEWVRAFLGDPALVLLERPARDLPAEWLDLLIARTDAARSRGAAVIWTTSDPAEWSDKRLNPTLKFVMKEMKMERVEG